MARPPAFWFWSFYFYSGKLATEGNTQVIKPCASSNQFTQVSWTKMSRQLLKPERERQLGLIKDAGHGQKRSSLSETQNKGC